MQMVMERVESLPTSRVMSTVPEIVDKVYQEVSAFGNGARVKALVHDKRTPLDQISRNLRAKGKVRTIVCINGKDSAGEPNSYALFVEWDEAQEAYQAKSRQRREGNEA